ncbi:MAG TPA: MBL fold metallo-hydrolase [Actinomycetota bacterium]
MTMQPRAIVPSEPPGIVAAVRLHVCGTRGSTPAPGREFVRYGGHTSCIAVSNGDEDPHMVLDGGTGLRTLSAILNGRAFAGTILLGHLHWDHTHGLPFFAAGMREGARVEVLMPAQGDASTVMARAVSPPHFPVTLEEFGTGAWSVASLEEGKHRIEGFDVLAREIPHKGGRTFGYRVSDGASSVAYLSDHAPIGEGPDGLGEYDEASRDLIEGVDLLVHDSQHVASEFAEKRYLGHSAVEYAIGLARECGAKSLMLFHHDPERTDDQIDEILTTVGRPSMPLFAATEGAAIDLPWP